MFLAYVCVFEAHSIRTLWASVWGWLTSHDWYKSRSRTGFAKTSTWWPTVSVNYGMIYYWFIMYRLFRYMIYEYIYIWLYMYRLDRWIMQNQKWAYRWYVSTLAIASRYRDGDTVAIFQQMWHEIIWLVVSIIFYFP